MQFCIRHFFAFSRESTPFVNAAAAVFLPRGSRLRETANSRPPVDNAKLRQFCIRHFFVISRESTPFVNAASAVFLPGDSRLRETANSRPPVDNVRLQQDCIRHFVFHCDGGVTLTPRKTTLPATHPSDTPRPSMQWKANYLTTVFTIRLQLCIYCLIDSFKLVSVNRRITAEKQSPQ